MTGLATALGAAQGVRGRRLLALGSGVLAGQLSIGWSNDLIDAPRDRAAGRRDKPLARGDLSEPAVRRATGTALVVSALATASCGARSSAVHEVLVVGSGWAYNAGMKNSAWSILPYGTAFGALPSVAALARREAPRPAPLWQTTAGALLGAAVHLVNVLPDLDADAATGVRGLPHRLGPRRLRQAAVGALLTGQGVVLAGTRPSARMAGASAVTSAALAATVLRGRGDWPFRAGLTAAALDAGLLLRQARRDRWEPGSPRAYPARRPSRTWARMPGTAASISSRQRTKPA